MRRTPPIARLAAVSLDSSDPAALAGFYRELLGLETFFETEDFVVVKGGGTTTASVVAGRSQAGISLRSTGSSPASIAATTAS